MKAFCHKQTEMSVVIHNFFLQKSHEHANHMTSEDLHAVLTTFMTFLHPFWNLKGLVFWNYMKNSIQYIIQKWSFCVPQKKILQVCNDMKVDGEFKAGEKMKQLIGNDVWVIRSKYGNLVWQLSWSTSQTSFYQIMI